MNKQIEEMRSDLVEIFDEEYEKRRLITPQNTADKLAVKGYRKQIVGEWRSEYQERPDWKGKMRQYYFPDCCSVCHEPVGDRTNFCPNCGARMKGEEDEKSD